MSPNWRTRLRQLPHIVAIGVIAMLLSFAVHSLVFYLRTWVGTIPSIILTILIVGAAISFRKHD